MYNELSQRPLARRAAMSSRYTVISYYTPYFFVPIHKDLENAAYSAYSAYFQCNQTLSLPIYASQLGTPAYFCLKYAAFRPPNLANHSFNSKYT